MAYIDKEWKRLIRIECDREHFQPWKLSISDHATGQQIANIKSMVIRLEAAQVNECEITYHEVDSAGKYLVDSTDGYKPLENTITLPDINIAGITAYEVDSWEERFDSTFCLYEPTEDGYENVEEKVKAFIRGLLGRR